MNARRKGLGLVGLFERYGEASEVVWLQEEPENMGAWSFVHARLHACLPERLRLSMET